MIGVPSPPSRAARALSYALRLGPAEEDWPSTRFGRLALINMLSAAGDTLVVVALAGSVFVSVPLNAARDRTALGLAMTMLPFAVVAPFTGPATDRVRRGKRAVLFLAAFGRMAAALMMAAWIHNLALFPAAFSSLVCSKTHAVARSALVPAVIEQEPDLLRANSRLAVGSGLASVAAAPVGAAVYAVFGSRALLDLDAFLFALVASLSLILLRAPADSAGRRTAPRGTRAVIAGPVRRTAVVMGSMRATTGFLTALVAFGLREQGAPVIWYGTVAAAGVAGSLVGAAVAPATERVIASEKWLVAGSALALAASAASVSALSWQHGRAAAVIVAATSGLAGSVARAAFDSMVQREVGEDGRARAFARFDASFQAAWVALALVPTVLMVPLTVGFVVMAIFLVGFVIGAAAAPRGVRHRTGKAE